MASDQWVINILIIPKQFEELIFRARARARMRTRKKLFTYLPRAANTGIDGSTF